MQRKSENLTLAVPVTFLSAVTKCLAKAAEGLTLAHSLREKSDVSQMVVGQEREAAGHMYPQPGSRETWMLFVAQLPSFIFFLVWGPSAWGTATHIRGGSGLLSSVNHFGNSLIDTPKDEFPEWF